MIDNFVSNPDRLVRKAASSQFRPGGQFYPGIRIEVLAVHEPARALRLRARERDADQDWSTPRREQLDARTGAARYVGLCLLGLGELGGILGRSRGTTL